MIEPTKVTNFNRTKKELAAFWIFCVCVAGKNSDTTAKTVNKMFSKVCPLSLLKKSEIEIDSILREYKVGQYTRLARCFAEVGKLALSEVSLSELLALHGVGNKTARFFLLHSRKDIECAVIDIHILRWLSEETGENMPANTPTNYSKYREIEKLFLTTVNSIWPDKSIADVDLMIWKAYSGR